MLLAVAVIAPVRRALNVAANAAETLLRTWRHRREISRLAELDDHQLKDLGLTRTDVSGALAVSVLDDPSHVLCDIAGAGHGQAARATSSRATRAVAITALPKET